MNNNHEGTFSTALAALKEGQFVRRAAWRNEFVALLGENYIPISAIADDRLRTVLDAAPSSHVRDVGNLRKFDLKGATVINGWLPTIEDLMADDWVRYDAAEIAALKMEWELQDAIAGPGVVSRESLVAFIVGQLAQLGIDHFGEYVPSSDTLGLKLMDDPYKDITIQVNDGGYELLVLGCVYAQGTGRLRVELLDAIGRDLEGSKRDFRRSVFTFEVLSEGPIPEGYSPNDILAEAGEGEFVGAWRSVGEERLDAKATVSALYRMGSEPAFFQLNDEGEDVDV